MSGSPVYAQDLPDVVDEQSPSLSPGLQLLQERDEEWTRARVSLPDPAEELTRDATVEVSHVNFLGGTVFEVEDLARDFKGMPGTRVTVGEIVDAVQGITRRYQDAGYPLSYAYLPRQSFSDGVVRVFVVEGFIARTEIEVDHAPVRNRVQALAERVVGERPLTQKTFDRYTVLIARIPGADLEVNAPVPRTPNGATTLRVQESGMRRVAPSFAVTGGDVDEFRLLANIRLQSNTRFADRLSLSSLIPVGENEERFYAAEYQQEIGTDGLQFQASASRFDTEQEASLPRNGDVRLWQDKVADRYTAGLDYPVLLSPSLSWTAGIRLDRREQRSQYDLGNDVTLQQDLDYSVAELRSTMRKARDGRRLELRVDVRQGVDLGGNRNELVLQNAQASVPLERSEELHFTRLGIEGRWIQTFDQTWRLGTRVAAFWSGDTLPEPERGHYGGNRFGRGYSEGQAKGDYGAAGEVELRYLRAVDGQWIDRVEPYVVLDGAATRFNQRRVEHDIASAAVGIEVARGRMYRFGIEYAVPVGDQDVETGSRDGRINLRLSWDLRG